MKKYFLFLLFLLPVYLYPQAEFADVSNPVYPFLERMYSLHIINDYDVFQKPKTRRAIGEYLLEVQAAENKLSEIDSGVFHDLMSEFALEMHHTTESFQSPFTGTGYEPFSQKERFLYYNVNEKGNFFINLTADAEPILHHTKNIGTTKATLLNGGGIIRGTLMDRLGFYIQGSNGFALANKSAALQKKLLQYNFKFNEKPDETFFDDNEGYVSLDYDWLNVKFGKDRLLLGYGENKTLMSDNGPKFDYLQFQFKYGIYSFSSFHGKLLGEESFIPDTITAGVNVVKEKYMAYHRLGFHLSDNVTFGAGEIIIYGERPAEFSYLNPFNFYKAAEHNNRDRDNAMIFFDFENRSIQGVRLFTMLLLDDINYSKLGSGWYGNQTLWDLGISYYTSNAIVPIDFHFQYTRVEPFVFTHRLSNNNFTTFGYGLSSVIAPNSELFFSKINFRLTSRIESAFSFSYTIHGANILDSFGNVVKNVGGDFTLGHRTWDADTVHFLDGEREYYRNMTVSLSYEPYNEIKFFFTLISTNYMQTNTLVKLNSDVVNAFFALQVKI